MFDMGFDPYAMVQPKTKEDVVALLDEAILIGEQLNEVVDRIIEIKNESNKNGK